jgi:hypothetical protein
MSFHRTPKMILAALALAVLGAPLFVGAAPAAAATSTDARDRRGPGDDENSDLKFSGKLDKGDKKDLMKNNRSSAMKVKASLTVCEKSEGAAITLVAMGAGGAFTKICEVHPDGSDCATSSCAGDLPAGKTLNVECDAGKDDTGGGLGSGCSYDVTVE